MKIGIITYHRGANYGAFLQAWSLKNYLLSKFKIEVEIIDYCSNEFIFSEKRIFFPQGKREFFNPVVLRRTLKYIKFRFWQKRYLKVDFLLKQDYKVAHYDLIIFGSDEIWNIKNWFGYTDLKLFGLGFDSCNAIISYGPSMGNSRISDFLNNPEISKNLRQFKELSVRDLNSKETLTKLGFNSKMVLDPTFLIDWSSILKNRKFFGKNYMLLNISNIHKLPSIIAFIKELASKHNWEIINLVYTFETNICKNISSPNPFQWVTYFANAQYVITDTFHGTIFSIQTERQFTVLDPETKSNKISGVLEFLQLERTFMSNIDFKLDKTIDYKSVSIMLKQKKNESMEFLNTEIGKLDLIRIH